MVQKYNDIYMRANLDDMGDNPRSGALCQSPDIIPWGVEPIANPAKFLTENWNKDLGRELIADTPNYIYLRAKNLATGQQNGKIYLYYSKASLLLYPNIWKDQVIKTSGKEYVEVYAAKNNDIVVGNNPCNWNPSMISNDHFCLISRVVTDEHQNPIPNVGDIDDFAKYVATNPNIGWRNVSVVDKGSPAFTIPVDYDQGTSQSEMHILLTCKNLPVGSEVGFSSENTSSDPPIYLKRTMINESKSLDLGMVSNIPANFKSEISYSYWSNGKQPTKGFSITLHVVKFYPPGHELFKYASHPKELNIPKNLLAKIGPEYGIELGSHTTTGI